MNCRGNATGSWYKGRVNIYSPSDDFNSLLVPTQGQHFQIAGITNLKIWKKTTKMEDDYYFIPLEILTNYRISKNGKILNVKTNRVLKTKKYEFETIILAKKTFYVHRLLAITFIPRPSDSEDIIRHINNDKLDNRLENIEWSTKEQTIVLPIESKHCKRVVQKKNSEKIAEFDSMIEAGKSVGLSASSISKVCLGHNKSAGGFQWEYLEKTKNYEDVPEGFIKVNMYPNYYISNEGQLYSKKTKRLLKACQNSVGYYYYSLCKNGSKRNCAIHRLVAEHFLKEQHDELEEKNPNETLFVNHINKKRYDNSVKNLEWVTHSENVLHSNCLKKIGL